MSTFVNKEIIDGVPTYRFGEISFKEALSIMDRSTGVMRFYVRTRVTTHELHSVSPSRHNIYKLTASSAEKLEVIIRLIDRYRSQRKMEQHDREAEGRYHARVSERMRDSE